MDVKLLVSVVLAVLVQSRAAPNPDQYGKEQPMPYNFEYGVKDEYAGTNFGQQETSDGNQVQGSYTVNLPDGRIQTVNYRADHDRGFIAEVKYDGQARYPPKSDKEPFVVKHQGGGGGGSYPQPPRNQYQ